MHHLTFLAESGEGGEEFQIWIESSKYLVRIGLWTYTRWAPSPVRIRRVVSCNSTYRGYNEPQLPIYISSIHRMFIGALKPI